MCSRSSSLIPIPKSEMAWCVQSLLPGQIVFAACSRRMPKFLRGRWVNFFCALTLTLVTVAPAANAAQVDKGTKNAGTEALQQHYQAARTYTVGGNTERAAVEYRAFLSEALTQMA